MDAMELFGELRQAPLEEFGEAFFSCKNAFRFEGLPLYRVEEEASAYENFCATGKCVDPDLNSEWKDILDLAAQRGARFRRVRLLSAPISTYENFEIECGYKKSTIWGEEIKYLSTPELLKIVSRIPALCDYWLFDEKIYLMNYDNIGQFMGVFSANQDVRSIYSKFSEDLISLSKDIENVFR